MARSIVDKIAAYVAARGTDGVEPGELATVFLSPSSGPKELCARLIRNVLAGDPRLVLGADGKWRMNRSSGAASDSAYTVIEATEVAAGARRCFISWAGLHVDAAGSAGPTVSSAIRPDDPWPPELILPPQIKAAVLAGPALSEAVQKAADFARGSTVVAFRIGGFQAAVARAIENSLSETAPPLSLERLGKRAPGLKADSREALAARLGLAAREPAGAADSARFTAEMLGAMLARKQDFGLGEPEGWTELQHPKKIEVDYSGYEFDRAFIESLPEAPGIYIMRDANGVAVYVGKASNLRARVGSYFRGRIERDEKTERILEALSRVEVTETGSELAALLAEHRAIRELQPAINIQFDVHERPAAAKPSAPRRILAILPAADAAEVEIILMHGDRAMRRVTLPREDAPERLRPVLAEFFFVKDKPPAPAAEAEREELQIARSWLDRNADRVNAFDVDLAGGLEGALALLGRYLREPLNSGKIFHV